VIALKSTNKFIFSNKNKIKKVS